MEKCYRILVIGDPHFKVNNPTETEEMSRQILKIATNKKPDLIVCLGDVLDRHQNIHVNPLTWAVKFLSDLSDIAPLYCLVGNHDRPNNSSFLTPYHGLTACSKWPNTTIVDQVKTLSLPSGLNLVFVPYVPPGRFHEALGTGNIELSNVHCIFAHQEFYGAKSNSISSKNGDSWPENYPLVISGHYHDYQRLANNLIYVGSPIQHKFEESEDKTISLFSFIPPSFTPPSNSPSSFTPNFNSTSTSTNINSTSWKEERLSLGLPVKKIYTMSVDQFLNWSPTNSNSTDLSHSKLIITGTSTEIQNVLKLPQVKSLLQSGLKISPRSENSLNDPLIGQNSETKSNFLPPDPSPQVQQPFLKKLENSTSSDTGLNFWFRHLFNPSSSTPSPVQYQPSLMTSQPQPSSMPRIRIGLGFRH